MDFYVSLQERPGARLGQLRSRFRRRRLALGLPSAQEAVSRHAHLEPDIRPVSSRVASEREEVPLCKASQGSSLHSEGSERITEESRNAKAIQAQIRSGEEPQSLRVPGKSNTTTSTTKPSPVNTENSGQILSKKPRPHFLPDTMSEDKSPRARNSSSSSWKALLDGGSRSASPAKDALENEDEIMADANEVAGKGKGESNEDTVGDGGDEGGSDENIAESSAEGDDSQSEEGSDDEEDEEDDEGEGSGDEDEDEDEDGDEEDEREAEKPATTTPDVTPPIEPKSPSKGQKSQKSPQGDSRTLSSNSSANSTHSPKAPASKSKAPISPAKALNRTSQSRRECCASSPDSFPLSALTPSQPFPMSSPDPVPFLDPTIDLSVRGELPPYELESSPEPDLPTLSQMLAKNSLGAVKGKGKAKAKDRSPSKDAEEPVGASKNDDDAGDEMLSAGNEVLSAHMSISEPLGVIKTETEVTIPASPAARAKSGPKPRPKFRKVHTPIEILDSSPSPVPIAPPTGKAKSKSVNKEKANADDKGKGKRKRTSEALSDAEAEPERSPSPIRENPSTPSPIPQKKPAKRPRTNRPATQKHDQFWILDGNTVLEAGGVLFRLHRSRLVDQSVLFARVFGGGDSVAEGDGEVEVVEDRDGVVCRLKNVSAADLQALLELDRDAMQFHFTKPTLSTLGSILRASTSLQFTRYRAFAIKFLEAEWSPSLDDITDEAKPGAVEVAVLGRRCNVPSVLKRAFYEMARGSGYGLSDGDEEEGMDVDGPWAGADAGTREAKEEIRRSDERLIERMREHFVLAWAQDAARLDLSFICPHQAKAKRQSSKAPVSSSQVSKDRRDLFVSQSQPVPSDSSFLPVSVFGLPSTSFSASASTSTPVARSPLKCTSINSKREAWDCRVHLAGIYQDFLFDPICGLQELINVKWEEEGWCEDCVRVRREAWERSRQRLWARIGAWMGVEKGGEGE
ncbi:hypothetical protein HYDPIDRAFT_32532 [Hydnomerulius pinastri MD-312]|uniref:Unplaced genomic scaffold scaffold_42, whole genome shotgun sequence n=1 Tax=Hydnomerulius pinastri MD-312 TaxID=994086 RepID=A0A0C9V409_9AGAM|nr:hypothetical protein HYDPIDRAFT_32532 [Hydnomerulius pinastri MD-312]